jgi:glycosyltransferase involved in cell wall biosynthesis
MALPPGNGTKTSMASLPGWKYAIHQHRLESTMNPLRVAIVHSYYSRKQPSGENNLVDEEIRLLQDAGHEVQALTCETDQLALRAGYHARTALNVALGRGHNPLRELERGRPDIIHVHNTFPNISSSWITEAPAPVVTTIHNFRTICAAGTMSREGKPCRSCLDHGPLQGLRHKCYRNSRIASAPLVAHMLRTPIHPLLKDSSRLIVLSEEARTTFRSVGSTHARIDVLPNPVVMGHPSVKNASQPENSSTPWLFAGRITIEKGILHLLKAWPQGQRLDIAGAGPAEDQAIAIAGEGINFLGALTPENLINRLKSARGLIIPSLWQEGAPLIYPQALALGVPVLALRGNAVAQAVEREKTGVVIDELTTAELERAMMLLAISPNNWANHCRAIAANEYSPSNWVKRLESIFEEAITESSRGDH